MNNLFEEITFFTQAKVDGDKPGLVAMLQKVLQFYASTVLSKRSYANKGDSIVFPDLSPLRMGVTAMSK